MLTAITMARYLRTKPACWMSSKMSGTRPPITFTTLATTHHVIKVEKIDNAVPGVAYPRLVSAIGACPPEDVDGLSGYADFLAAMADLNHGKHNRMLGWYRRQFDLKEAEMSRILDNFEHLAQKLAPNSRRSKATPRSLLSLTQAHDLPQILKVKPQDEKMLLSLCVRVEQEVKASSRISKVHVRNLRLRLFLLSS